MADLLILLAVGAGVFWLLLVLWTMHALTAPHRRGYAWAVAKGRPGDPGELPEAPRFTEWILKSQGRLLPVWDITGNDPQGPVIVLSPGWGQGRIGCLDRASGVLGCASRVLVWDMPSMGDAPGRSTLGARESAMLSDLIDQAHPEHPMLLMGVSMGAGVSIVAAAARSDIAGVIAEAPYRVPLTPALGVLRSAQLPHHLSLRPALALLGLFLGVGPRWRGFDRATHARRLTCPLLILHGDQDTISPLDDARAIAQAAPDAELVVTEEGDHHALWKDPAWRERQMQATQDWVKRHFGSDQERAGPDSA